MAERVPDWQCPNPSCMNHSKLVFGNRASCPKCGSARDDGGMHSSFGGAPDGSNDWQCPNTTCLNNTKLVFGRHSSCPACGTARNAKAAGDWACPNGSCVNHTNTVFASKSQCPKCGTPKPFPGQQQMRLQMHMPMAMQHGFGGGRGMPPAALMGQAPGGDWQCPNPGCVNHSKMVFGKNPSCPKCGSAKPAGGMMGGMLRGMMGGMQMGGMQLGVNAAGDWQCPNPGCVNHSKMVFGKNDSCPKCGSAKPAGGMAMMLAGGGAPMGDWQCPNSDCQNHRRMVFAKNESCPQCGSAKPANGGMTMLLGGGGGSPLGDWQCPNSDCQNHSRMVFGKNASCPQCGSPKPIGYVMGVAGMVGQRGGSQPGDWRCPNPDCKNHRNSVFAKHSSCPSCGMEKPEVDVFGGGDRSRSPHGRGFM